MKVLAAAILILLMSFSLCMANNNPNEAEATYRKAMSTYNKGKLKEAVKILEGYVKEHPDPKAYYFLGYAYYRMKKMNTAMKYFKEAYEANPDFSPVGEKEESQQP
ncbi:MAG: tetratricopeptide repeat protein [Nitrospirae bacterium]|nr:tetratricopeptide repeat protein [Nitrospirota bacterium]